MESSDEGCAGRARARVDRSCACESQAMTGGSIELTMCFKIHVLGHFRLLKSDVPIQVPRRLRKPQELLQALIALGGTEVGAGALIDALWPESAGVAVYPAL